MKIAIFIRRFFFVSSWTQLWFFLSSAYAMAIICILARIVKIKWILYIGTAATMLSACVQDCYVWIVTDYIPFSDNIFEIFAELKPFLGTIFGGVSMALMYIALGMVIAEKQAQLSEWIQNKIGNYSKIPILIVIGIGILTAEVVYDYSSGAREFSRMISLAPLAFFIVIYAINGEQIKISRETCKTLRAISTLMYGFHGIVSFYIQKSIIGLRSLSYFFIIIIVSFLLCLLTLRLNKTKIKIFTNWLF